MSARKEWMLGIPGHNELVNIDQVLLLVRGGSLRPTDLVKKLGEPWRAANEVSELAPHFSGSPPPAAAKVQVETAPPPSKSQDAQRGEPIRTTTDRVPRTGGKIPDSSKTIPKADPKPATRPPDEEKGPIRSQTGRVATVSSPPKPETRVGPPVQEKKKERETDVGKSETKPGSETKTDPGKETKTDGDKTDKISRRKPIEMNKPVVTPRPIPKPEPQIEPMVQKYYSPVDILRGASFAFEPKKLLYSSPVVVLMIIWSIGMYRSEGGVGGGVFEGILFILFMGILIFGMAFILTSLAFVSRRQLEGRDYYLGEVVHYTTKSAVTALVYPLVALAPSLISLGILYLLGLARNRSGGMASALKVGFILPMIFAFITVLGILVYQIASMYVPAAGAIEGERLGGSIRHAWNHIRRQWGRVILHWLIVTVAFGVISAVCMGLSSLAIILPDLIFGIPDSTIAESWNQFAPLQAVYRGIAYGLGMLLPVSLLSTLGTLSYVSLRTPAGAQIMSSMDDTSGMAIQKMSSSHHPGESTNPSDTRPALSDTSAPSASSPPLSDISDDSDEQPLVKD
jgi:hypothetical protein